MKAKLTGLGILLLVILLAVGYTLLGRSRETAEISGYVGMPDKAQAKLEEMLGTFALN